LEIEEEKRYTTPGLDIDELDEQGMPTMCKRYPTLVGVSSVGSELLPQSAAGPIYLSSGSKLSNISGQCATEALQLQQQQQLNFGLGAECIVGKGQLLSQTYPEYIRMVEATERALKERNLGQLPQDSFLPDLSSSDPWSDEFQPIANNSWSQSSLRHLKPEESSTVGVQAANFNRADSSSISSDSGKTTAARDIAMARRLEGNSSIRVFVDVLKRFEELGSYYYLSVEFPGSRNCLVQSCSESEVHLWSTAVNFCQILNFCSPSPQA
jgi:hypothetical protein